MTSVHISQAIYDEIIVHAREGKPEEICGILSGNNLQAKKLIRGRNIAQERIENYEVDPQTLLMQFNFDDPADEMMGIYHSHPVSVAYPSATDAWNANYPDSIYFICSLEYDDAPVIRAFQMTPYFLDLDIRALRQTLSFYETRPGLFAYYQANDKPVPDALAAIAGEVTKPFYVVYYSADNQEFDSRAVSLEEFVVEVTP
ncbi:MAG: M67 family metallopeptidase [Chloroflexi bacterium]|nr:M67 family metallopeptidase [Chloroflexota bacterium]